MQGLVTASFVVRPAAGVVIVSYSTGFNLGNARNLWIGWEGAYLPDDRMKVPSKADVAASVGKVPPMLGVVPDPAEGDDRPAGGSSLLDEIAREGARRRLAEALQAEVDASPQQSTRASVMSTGITWWCATARTSRGRS
ncbi:hypothetical protein [Salinifilum ghardaiensis]